MLKIKQWKLGGLLQEGEESEEGAFDCTERYKYLNRRPLVLAAGVVPSEGAPAFFHSGAEVLPDPCIGAFEAV